MNKLFPESSIGLIKGRKREKEGERVGRRKKEGEGGEKGMQKRRNAGRKEESKEK